MKLPQLLSTAFFITAFSSLAQAQMTADQVKMAMNKETNQLEVHQQSNDKNITDLFTLQFAELGIFADGDAAGMVELKNSWAVPVSEFLEGEIVHLHAIEIVEKTTGKVLKFNGDIQVFPQ